MNEETQSGAGSVPQKDSSSKASPEPGKESREKTFDELKAEIENDLRTNDISRTFLNTMRTEKAQSSLLQD
jgi:hypothetical protein